MKNPRPKPNERRLRTCRHCEAVTEQVASYIDATRYNWVCIVCQAPHVKPTLPPIQDAGEANAVSLACQDGDHKLCNGLARVPDTTRQERCGCACQHPALLTEEEIMKLPRCGHTPREHEEMGWTCPGYGQDSPEVK